jgi:hypothetical protein
MFCIRYSTDALVRPMTAPAPSDWLARAQSLHELGRTQEATELLIAVANDFESNSTIPFHLARYCCGLGQADEAFGWRRS